MLDKLLGDAQNICNIDLEVLAHGLCTPGMLKKYISGKMRPEKLLIDALWQRIDGRSMEKFEINLDMDEYNLACSRAKIQELIRHGKLLEAEQELKNYEVISDANKRPLHRQFACLQWSEIYRRQQKSFSSQEEIILEGLAQTLPKISISPEIMETHRFSMMELLLLEQYAFLIENKSPGLAVRWYQAIQQYIDKASPKGFDFDLADKYKLLPPVLYRLAKRFSMSEMYEEALEWLKKGCSMLSQRKMLSALFVSMKELEFEILQKTGREIPEWQQECLNLIVEFVGKGNHNWREITHPDYTEHTLHCVNSTLRERRLAHGFRLEDLAGGECDPRTLKAAENGTRRLQTAKKEYLYHELGLSTRKFDGSLITRCYPDFRKFSRLVECYNEENFDEAEQIYKELIQGLNMDEVTNQQFVQYWNICLRYSKREISKQDYRAKLMELLKKTLPDLGELGANCILTKYERDIIEDLSWNVDLEDAGQVEKLLEGQYHRFTKEKVLICFFPEYYTTISYCLGRIAKLRHDFKKAEYYLDTVLEQIWLLPDNFNWDTLLFQRFQLEEEKQKTRKLSCYQESDNYFCWIKRTYAISKIYLQNNVLTEFIENYLDNYYKSKKQILQKLL